jgi:glutaredoxin
MIIIYGDSENCFTCKVLKSILSKSNVSFRFYEMNKDYTLQEVMELYPEFDTVPFILNDGKIITLNELERILNI